jgi:hypothetical protein
MNVKETICYLCVRTPVTYVSGLYSTCKWGDAEGRGASPHHAASQDRPARSPVIRSAIFQLKVT